MLREDKAGISSTSTVAVQTDRTAAVTSTSTTGSLLSRRKFGPQLAGSLAASVILGSASIHGLKNLRTWVESQSDFQILPDQIIITPEPPEWLEGARDTVIDLLPELAEPGHGLSSLSFNAEELSRRINLQVPWIEKVQSIEIRHPARLLIQAQFRNPLMSLTLPDRERILLDRFGVVLSSKRVQKERLESVIEFNYAARLIDMVERRGGKNPTTMPEGDVWSDPRVTQALNLAEFLYRKQAPGKSGRQMFRLIDAVTVSDRIILRTVDGLWIVWGMPPGEEIPGEPNADAKWKMMMDWLDKNSHATQFDLERAMLLFEKERAVLKLSST